MRNGCHRGRWTAPFSSPRRGASQESDAGTDLRQDRLMKLTIRPLTPELFPALEDLFGKPGASNGCWCMYWRIGPEYRERPRAQNRLALRQIVDEGPPPGLLAFDGELAVGWCQLTPRRALPWLERTRALGPVDELPVWAI